MLEKIVKNLCLSEERPLNPTSSGIPQGLPQGDFEGL